MKLRALDLNPTRGARTARAAEPEAPAAASAPEIHSERLAETWTVGATWKAKASSVLLVGACLSGVVAGPMLLWQNAHPQAPVVKSGEDGALARRREAATDRAVQWVRAWASTSRAKSASLKSFYGGDVVLPEAAGTVRQVSPVSAVAAAPGVWAVTCALTTTPAGAPEGSTVTRYVLTHISVEGSEAEALAGARVMDLPAVVPGPGDAPNRAGTYNVQLVDGAPLHGAVTGFLRALLLGDGDINRFVRPGARITPLPPEARYGAVKVDRVQASADVPGGVQGPPPEGASVRVRVLVSLTEPASGVAAQGGAEAPSPAPSVTASTFGLQASYGLTLTARAGRWEVSAIDLAPVLSETKKSS